jgi:hypothetical protein
MMMRGKRQRKRKRVMWEGEGQATNKVRPYVFDKGRPIDSGEERSFSARSY